MKYKGYWLCSETESSKFLQLYHNLTTLYSNVIFNLLSFEKCGHILPEANPDLHIIIAELSPQDEPEIWFPLISNLSAIYPHLKIIIILTGKPEHNFYYLNQISFTYLIPENQVAELLPRGMDIAIRELRYYNSLRVNKRITSEPDLLSAIYFSTDNLMNKGNKGCHIHYPDGETEYTRLSLKNILPQLPAYFLQIHKSYVINMHYYKDYRQKPRPSGISCDEYILLSEDNTSVGTEIPIGPKFRNSVMEYILTNHIRTFTHDS